ncbi:MAG: hypothetical protein CL587_19350 [Alteromonadaceae bacterium]|nr:hypothetical protein DS731_04355 [Alteromonas sp. RKMC-009]MBT82533.1 hypothetical protein [Alteromonadaceae bacterium]
MANRTLRYTTLCMATLPAFTLSAAEVEISVENLTRGIAFTPLFIAAHSSDTHLFVTGEAASTELQAMAEGGDISGLETVAAGASADMVSNPAGGLLMPAMTTSAMLTTTDGNTQLSLVAMLLPTNDGFVGLDSWTIPETPGTYMIYLNAYDAGTEANDEVRGSGVPGEAGMPVPPPLEALVGTDGTGVNATITNATVHIHPGNLGDDMLSGGMSDVQNTVQRWLNPVARVVVTVSE